MPSPIRKLVIRARLRAALLQRLARYRGHADISGPRRVFVALAADYGNLGDLAITYAQKRFLQQAFPDANVEMLPISNTLSDVAQLRRRLRPHDIITLVGGGNTGDMYDDIQHLRELIIKSFPRNPIVSFPQTVDFSDTLYGRWAERRARKVYNGHGNLLLLARDTQSQERASKLFTRCSVRLAPDVVLTLDRSRPAAARRGVVIALRSDGERGLGDLEHTTLQIVARRIGEVREQDTHIGDVRVTEVEAEGVLDDYWKDLRSARLVITDRLHAMIFAIITNTPCVVFDSRTGKVGQFYDDWLKHLPQVRLLRTSDEAVIEAACRDVLDADRRTIIDLQESFARAFGSWTVPASPHD